MALAVVMLAAALVLAGWYYYTETRRSLDDEFGRRLVAIAELAASRVSRSAAPTTRESFADSLASSLMRAELERIRVEHHLFNVVVLGEDFVTLMSLEPTLYPEGSEYPHWHADYPAISRASAGEPAATPLYTVRGTFLKAGYARLTAGGKELVAFVGVEADAEFLDALTRLRLILIAVTGISVAGIVLFTVFALRATSSLLRARESLMRAETLAIMGRMAAGIAHEIRNPLFIIRSAAEKLAAKHPESGSDIRSYFMDEVDRLNGILTDYLLFAKDEPSRRSPMDLVVTLNRCVRNLRESTAPPDIRIETAFDPSEAPFIGEEKRLQQAFLNILINARQALPSGGTIAVSLANGDGRYTVRFRDTGAGIAARDIDRIFEPFFTTKSQGSGLGLAITRKIIEAHGGEIAIESEPGAGTTVSISLPAPDRATGSAGGGSDGA